MKTIARRASIFPRCTTSLAALAVALAASVSPACAQDRATRPAVQDTREFHIAAQPLDQALKEFARAADVQLAYSAELVAGRSSPGVDGSFTVQEALARLLAGTGLASHMSDARTFSLAPVVTVDGERVTGAVRIEGGAGSPYFGGAGRDAGVNGVNGSRDITATEGTGSFTSGAVTIGSKAPQAIKDVPQSVSVLTSQRLQEQNVTDFSSAMKQLPGVTLTQGRSNLETNFLSRGFVIRSIQVDGGAPLPTSDTGFQPQIDMSVYDHVELLRGASGVLTGYGDPSGTVNLVRKKPLDHAQYTIDAQAGSWQNYRVVADATSPLALNGALRGRLVMTYQNNRNFYEGAKDRKNIIYGIAELDATPTTLLTAGLTYSNQNSRPWFGGLPRYSNGADIKLPRSTSFAFPWNRWNFDTTEIFGSVEQKIHSDWNLKVSATYNRQTSQYKYGYVQGAVDPDTGRGASFQASYGDTASKQLSLEALLTGAFSIFGQRQEVTMGASRVVSDAGGQYDYQSVIPGSWDQPYQPYSGGPLFCGDTSICPSGLYYPPVNVRDFHLGDPLYSEPANPLPVAYYPKNKTVEYGAYVNVRLTAFNRLHLMAGVRWSWLNTNSVQQGLCTNTYSPCTTIGAINRTTLTRYKVSNFSWPPAVTGSFDITKSLTAYVGYTDIYRSQANFVKPDRTPIDPLTGANWEGGLKWAPRGGKLNVSLSAYRLTQKGFQLRDFSYPPFLQVGPGVTCCFYNNPDGKYEAKGFDFDATGEVLPGWQIAANFTYSTNKQTGSGTPREGQPFTSQQPKNLYKLWTSFDFGASGFKKGWLSGLTVSAGINGQSSSYYSGSVCVHPGPPDPVTGYSQCTSYDVPDTVPFAFTVPAYVVASARIDYRISGTWSASLNLENLFDKSYYQSVGSSPDAGNWYGTPRSFAAAIHAKW
ncbi:TonB-dependent siderophore receptor [Sphingomonas sp. OTU376]|uniref:TonB-dependent siderophore receptor n=1 Tax=Sphingomonas sp. OTU376 TaxID=3043863 RepID=UPI00313E48D4